MSQPTIVCYLKTYCGWSEGIRSIMRKYNLSFEEKDIIKNPAFRWEMEQKSEQPLSPCVLIGETMLADVSGEEVEQWLVEQKLVEHISEKPDAPIDRSCDPAIHEKRKLEAQNQTSPASRIQLID